MIDYSKQGELHLVTLNEGQNTISPEWQQRMLDILDRIEGDCGRGSALVLTGVDKFFCNGLDLPALSRLPPEKLPSFGQRQAAIHSRLLVLPCPTVAAINGHAFAGGAFLALSCDYRLMREDRGWFCVSEVDVGVPVPPAMMGILQGKLPASTTRDALLTGRRYTADEAIAAGIVDGKASGERLLEQAMALAGQLATKDPGIFMALKQTLFGPMAAALLSG